MAFMSGGFLLRESVQVGALFLELDDWNSVRNRILDKNLLQVRKASSSKRLAREIIFRLRQLHEPEIKFFVEANPQDQAYLLWVAICRRYSLIADFMEEVVREKYLSLRADVGYPDFDAFVESKRALHPELDEIASSTKSKLRQVLFRMLREARLLSKDKQIILPAMSRELASLLLSSDAAETRYFPVTENDLRNIAE